MEKIFGEFIGSLPMALVVGLLGKYLVDKLPSIVDEFYKIKERISVLEERTKNIKN
jgi:hypothetical protein